MISLDFFPSELLSHICKFVDPEDFTTFSLLNKRFCAIAGPFRQHHDEQWNKYAVLQDRPNTSPWFWYNILRSVVNGWDGAKYIRTLEATYTRDAPWSLEQNEPMHDWNPEICEEVVTSRVARTQHALQRSLQRTSIPSEHRLVIKEALKMTPWLTEHISEPYSTSLVLAVLALHLPNLRKLVVSRYSSSKLKFLNAAVTHAALEAASVSRAPLHGALRRLREVDFTTGESEDYPEHLDYVYGAPGDFEASFLYPFLALPSIQTLKADRVIGQASPQASPQVAKLAPWKLASLVLRKSDISPDAFSSLLEGMTGLRSCEMTTTSTSLQFSVPATIGALLRTASKTLERLTIHAQLQNALPGRTMSLAAFEALTYLDISYDCLCLPPFNSIKGADILSTALPASLQTLKLHAPQFRETLSLHVLALLVASPPKQEALKCLSIKSWIEDSDKKAMQEACQRRGIRCEGDLAINGIYRSNEATMTAPAIRMLPSTAVFRGPRIRPELSLHTLHGFDS